MLSLPPHSAILLIAHGSRLASANQDLCRLAEFLRQRFSDHVVETAYLELTEPTIPQGAAACVSHNVSRVFMLPYFLSAGTHVTNDLTQFQADFTAKWPGVRFDLCPPLGLHPLMAEILCDRLAEAL